MGELGIAMRKRLGIDHVGYPLLFGCPAFFHGYQYMAKVYTEAKQRPHYIIQESR